MTRGKNSTQSLASTTERILVLSANSAWNLANFRSRLISDLIDAGYRVVAAAPPDTYSARIEGLGAEFRPIAVQSSGLSPLADVRLFTDYVALFRQLDPFAYLGFTAKPNIYGSLAAGLLGIKTVNNISGLGTAFIRPGPLRMLVSLLYRAGMRKSSRVLFQNADDRKLFVDGRIVDWDRTSVIPGSGVDLQHFSPSPDLRRDGAFRFLFVGRLLRDKGICEYVEAARSLHASWPTARFQILGFLGVDNRTAVPSDEIERWGREGRVEYLGESDDVRPYLEQADCVVLPSYREGLPRVLLEASAMARPMIATDVPGCRDVIVEGETGFLCEARSAASLAAAMDKMLRLGPAERADMGRRARMRVERNFDAALVSKTYLEVLEQ